jgi:hypothetical protein
MEKVCEYFDSKGIKLLPLRLNQDGKLLGFLLLSSLPNEQDQSLLKILKIGVPNCFLQYWKLLRFVMGSSNKL